MYPDYIDYGSDYFISDCSYGYILTDRHIRHLFKDSGFKIIRKVVMRGNFRGFGRWLIYPFHLLFKTFAGILFRLTGWEIFFKIKITFGRNVVVVGVPI